MLDAADCIDCVHLGTCSMLRDVSGGVPLFIFFKPFLISWNTKKMNRDFQVSEVVLAHCTL